MNYHSQSSHSSGFSRYIMHACVVVWIVMWSGIQFYMPKHILYSIKSTLTETSINFYKQLELSLFLCEHFVSSAASLNKQRKSPFTCDNFLIITHSLATSKCTIIIMTMIKLFFSVGWTMSAYSYSHYNILSVSGITFLFYVIMEV